MNDYQNDKCECKLSNDKLHVVLVDTWNQIKYWNRNDINVIWMELHKKLYFDFINVIFSYSVLCLWLMHFCDVCM